MPTDAEMELRKVTEVKPGKDRQAYLEKLAKAANGLPEKQWNKLSEEAAEWVNAAIDALNREEDELPDFDEEAEEEEVEEERPARRGKRAAAVEEEDPEEEAEEDAEEESEEEPDEEEAEEAEEEDAEEEPAPRKRGRRAAAEEEDESEDVDEPAPRRAAKKAATKPAARRRAAAEEDEEEAPRSRKSAGKVDKEGGAQDIIMRMMLDNPDIERNKIFETLKKKGLQTSLLTVSNTYTAFRRALRVIKEAGRLKPPRA